MASLLTPDICVIGAGPAGLAAAEAARGYGATVVLVESDRMGGAKLHLGSVPSKALAAAAGRAQALRTATAFGITPDEPKVNFGRIHDHIQEVIAGISPQESAERFAALGVELIKAEAKFVDRRTLRAGDQTIRARRFIVATGSKPVPFDIPGLAEITPFTAETIFENSRRPGHLIVVGSDRLALELAQSHRRLGSEVTVIALGPVLEDTDPELRDIVMQRLREEGIAFRETATIASVNARGAGIALQVREKEAESEETLNASHLLLLGARVPALDDLDLDKAGARRDKARPDHLVLKRNFKTTNPKIHAIGDAAGAWSIHAAIHQAQLVVRNALFGYAAASDAIFATVGYTDPEIAEVGISEPEAKDRLKDRYRVVRAAFAENDRARATRETYGVAKVIADRGGRILGAGLVGPSAGEGINVFALAIAKGLTVADLTSFVAPHPTLGEIVNRLGEAWDKNQKPSPWLERRLKMQRMLP
jgi:pyruvate/2-oxoglutarate dehydrogenase complex dihydrolipoamide dehydrogenase (E3) component